MAEQSRKRCLDVINDYWRKNYSSPSIAEIVSLGGFKSTSHVYYMLKVLRRDMLILPNAIRKRVIVPSWVQDAINRFEA